MDMTPDTRANLRAERKIETQQQILLRLLPFAVIFLGGALIIGLTGPHFNTVSYDGLIVAEARWGGLGTSADEVAEELGNSWLEGETNLSVMTDLEPAVAAEFYAGRSNPADLGPYPYGFAVILTNEGCTLAYIFIDDGELIVQLLEPGAENSFFPPHPTATITAGGLASSVVQVTLDEQIGIADSLILTARANGANC